MTIDLRLGRWQDVLNDGVFDAVLTDPPYGGRTHEGWNAGAEQAVGVTGQEVRAEIDYASWTPDNVVEFVDNFAPRTRGWFGAMTSHDLVMPFIEAFERHGRFAFAPVTIIQKRPRLLGDGPSSWTVYLCVSRPRTIEFSRWGCLPGSYFSETARDGVAGGKPLGLMRSIVRDYTREGDVVCDPFSGGGTTALACRETGRAFVGAEMDRAHHAIAMSRLARAVTVDLFAGSTA